MKTGMILVLLVGMLLIYSSQFYKKKLRGLVLLWIGIVLIAFGMLSNPYTLILLFSFLIILSLRYLIARRQPAVIAIENNELQVSEQNWFNTKKTPDEVYKFDDIHLQHAIGDIMIDLTTAANLTQDNVIVVHQLLGKTTIVVPHHYQVKVDYSSLYGQLTVDDEFTRRSKNQRLTYMTPGYANGVLIKVMVSSIIGDLEVIHR
ncbi:transporter [Macrococcus carouselicus]|uniref:Transporter n=1 Tax=Macrococcus carouselicus TaxID=69969 RepID=A0A9Q8FP31_9STAP|nr:transporter [Macrococcus carouselicus]